MTNKSEFVNYLKEYNLSFLEIEKKIAIEAAWNDLIYKKFANQIEIDEIKKVVNDDDSQYTREKAEKKSFAKIHDDDEDTARIGRSGDPLKFKKI